MNNAKMEYTFNLANVIKNIEQNDYDVVISVSGGKTFSKETKEMLRQYDVDKEFLADNSDEYNKLGILNIRKNEITFTWKKVDVEVEEATSLEGITGNNKDISVTMDEKGKVIMKAGSSEYDYSVGINVVVYDSYFEKVAATFNESK